MTTMTYHARYERAERIDKIVDYFKGDFGEVLAECPAPSNVYKVLLTSGIIQCFESAAKKRLVTMYMGRVPEITGIYTAVHRVSRLPDGVYKMAKRSEKIGLMLN